MALRLSSSSTSCAGPEACDPKRELRSSGHVRVGGVGGEADLKLVRVYETIAVRGGVGDKLGGGREAFVLLRRGQPRLVSSS